MSVSLLLWYVFVRLFTFVVSFCLTDLSVPPKTTTNKQTAQHNSKKPQIESLLKTSCDHEDSKKKTGLWKGGYNNLINNSNNNNKKAGGGWESGTFKMLTAREGENSWGIWAYMLGPLPWVCHSSKLCQPSLSRARHVCSGIMGKRGSRWTKHGWGCEGHWGFSGPCQRGFFFLLFFFLFFYMLLPNIYSSV